MTIKELRNELLESGAVDNADIDWILCEVFHIKRSEVSLPRNVSEVEKEKVYKIFNERMLGRPLAYILGYTEFYGRKINVREGCLIPRCETEELVEFVLKNIPFGKGLEIGIGSGAISLSIALENQNIKMTAVDISDDAIAISMENIKNNNADVEVIKSNLFESLIGRKFDFIVSNPPYIKSEEINTLDREVKDFEPRIALDGGEDGLDFYREIIRQAPSFLNKGGKIFFEVGIGEADSVSALLKENFVGINKKQDLEGIDRIVYGTFLG